MVLLQKYNIEVLLKPQQNLDNPADIRLDDCSINKNSRLLEFYKKRIFIYFKT